MFRLFQIDNDAQNLALNIVNATADVAQAACYVMRSVNADSKFTAFKFEPELFETSKRTKTTTTGGTYDTPNYTPFSTYSRGYVAPSFDAVMRPAYTVSSIWKKIEPYTYSPSVPSRSVFGSFSWHYNLRSTSTQSGEILPGVMVPIFIIFSVLFVVLLIIFCVDSIRLLGSKAPN